MTNSRPYGSERQFQIYLTGLQGQRPALPIASDALERQANERMSPEARGYIAGGAGSEDTMLANRAAFRRWRIVPRMLRDVSQRDLSVQILAMQLPFPLLLAPIGVQSIVHPEAEVAVARAASSLAMPLILSTASSKSIEDVAQAMGDVTRWYQLYWSKLPDLNASFVSRAERAGYKAIVVTLDTGLLSWRPQDLQQAYLPFLLGEGLANYFSDPVFRQALDQSPEENPLAAIQHFITIFSNPMLTWEDLNFLRQHTSLPIVLKGIMHPDDALKALDYGIDGIIVSNHGGRQVDGAQASLDALPRIGAALKGQIPLLFDSGIRDGADAFKALALGARAVLLGRPYIWGLALSGEEGVREVLQNFLADLDLTLALSGYTSFREVDVSALVRE
ncbi:MAG: alpha-hydroxy-acid oxidizing protein [Ktedonobacteraceae bacterium]|nr:alpha-hydroxy-acid oxidizing protein [Ktedonobacteraceae bacterium]